MHQAISDIPLECLQKQIDKPFESREQREEIMAVMNEFAQNFSQVCDDIEESTALIRSFVGEEHVAAGDQRIVKSRRLTLTTLVIVRMTACFPSMNGVLMVAYILTRIWRLPSGACANNFASKNVNSRLTSGMV
jgi:hypothetical protein